MIRLITPIRSGINIKSSGNANYVKTKIKIMPQESGKIISLISGLGLRPLNNNIGFYILLGNGENLEVLPLLEIDFSHLPEGVERFYSDRVKNHIDHYLRFHCPAHLPHSMVEKIENGCRKIFRLLELQDYARIDIRVKDGEYYVLEVNSLPLLVPVYSDITKMAKAAGYIYEGLILRILAYSFKRWGITSQEIR